MSRVNSLEKLGVIRQIINNSKLALEIENDVLNLIQKTIIEDRLGKQNNNSDIIEISTDEDDNNDENDVSNLVEQSTIENKSDKQNNDSETIVISTDDEEINDDQNYISNVVEQSKVKNKSDKQNDDLETNEISTDEEEIDDDQSNVGNFAEQSTVNNKSDKQNDDLETIEISTDEEEIDHDQNDVANHVEPSTVENKSDKQNNDLETIVISTDDEEIDDDQNYVSNVIKQSTVNNKSDKQNDDLETNEISTDEEEIDDNENDVSNLVEQSIVENNSDKRKNNTETIEISTDEEETDDDQNYVSNLVEQSTIENKSDKISVQYTKNNYSTIVKHTNKKTCSGNMVIVTSSDNDKNITINKTKTNAMTKNSKTKNLLNNTTSDVIPKFRKSNNQVNKSLLTLKANSNIQYLTSDNNNCDTDSRSTGTLRMSTSTKKIREKNTNSIMTETAIINQKESEAKIVLNNITSGVKTPYAKINMSKSNKSYPNRSTTNNLETKDNDLVDLISNNDSSTDSNSSNSLDTRIKTRKKITKKNVSSELSSRRHLHTRGNKSNSCNKLNVKSASRKTITRDKWSPINSVRDSLKSKNVLQLPGKTSRKKENNLNTKQLKSTGKNTIQHTPSINFEDKNSTTETKTKIDKITKKSTLPIRITRQKITLTDSRPLESDKIYNIIKNNVSKSEKISQSKRKNTTDSSEYESMSEIEEVSEKSELINNLLKPNEQKSKYKKVQNGKSSSSLSTKYNKKEITNEPSAQRPTRTCKRTADTSTSQTNSKGPKLDNLSNVASLTITHVSPHNHSSIEVKRTRNMTKKIAEQVSNNSSFETTLANKKEKPKLSDNTHGKKRELELEDSSNTSTTSRKVIRKTQKK